MKYFSHEWAALDDAASEGLVGKYFESLTTLGKVGEKAASFHELVDLRDSLIDRIVFNQNGRNDLSIKIVTGDVERGYSLLTLIYSNGSIAHTCSSYNIYEVIDFRSTRIRFHEIQGGGDNVGELRSFTHNILLWPVNRGELVVSFLDFSWDSAPLPDRGFQTYGMSIQDEFE